MKLPISLYFLLATTTFSCSTSLICMRNCFKYFMEVDKYFLAWSNDLISLVISITICSDFSALSLMSFTFPNNSYSKINHLLCAVVFLKRNTYVNRLFSILQVFLSLCTNITLISHFFYNIFIHFLNLILEFGHSGVQ